MNHWRTGKKRNPRTMAASSKMMTMALVGFIYAFSKYRVRKSQLDAPRRLLVAAGEHFR
jgi:hypothetical protein